MKISNVRLGFATNSSSSHSIVVLPKGVSAPLGFDVIEGEYGWESFVLKNRQGKLSYLAAAVGSSLLEFYGEDLTEIIMREWFHGIPWSKGWYIDHNSAIEIPHDPITKQVSQLFVQDFSRFMSRKDVVVLGGNDNSDRRDFEEYYQYEVDLPRGWNLKWYAQKSGDWWTMFCVETGAKMRFSFEENPQDLWRSVYPELIDFKITDYCPFDCPFCYQDSSRHGVHAPLSTIESYLEMMSNSGVFEIAFGGGEPTLHPDFVKILRKTHSLGIVPNFTTKVTPEHWSPDLLQAVMEVVGGVAISVENTWEVSKLKAAEVLYGLRGKISAHFVVGAHPDWRLEDVIESCAENEIPLTLLGFKKVGRGTDPKPQTITPSVLHRGWRLSVDTAFVEQYVDVIEKDGIPDLLVVPGEGRFSMYIDAVSQRAGISSYHSDLVEFEPQHWTDLTDIWVILDEYVN
jgi:hypothetical protein